MIKITARDGDDMLLERRPTFDEVIAFKRDAPVLTRHYGWRRR
jgi:hypothetical protein